MSIFNFSKHFREAACYVWASQVVLYGVEMPPRILVHSIGSYLMNQTLRGSFVGHTPYPTEFSTEGLRAYGPSFRSQCRLVHGPTVGHACSNPTKTRIFKIIKNCCYTTTMDFMEAALANLSATADKHKVKRSALSRRWNKVTRSREDGYDLTIPQLYIVKSAY